MTFTGVTVIPGYQTLMRPVLRCLQSGEVFFGDVMEPLVDEFGLSQEEREVLLELLQFKQ